MFKTTKKTLTALSHACENLVVICKFRYLVKNVYFLTFAYILSIQATFLKIKVFLKFGLWKFFSCHVVFIALMKFISETSTSITWILMIVRISHTASLLKYIAMTSGLMFCKLIQLCTHHPPPNIETCSVVPAFTS